MSSDCIVDDGYHPYHKRRLAEGNMKMKVGDLVKFKRYGLDLFGIVIESVYSGGAFWVISREGERYRVAAGSVEVINEDR